MVAEFGGFQNVAQVNGGGLCVGHLNTHGALAGNGCLDTHTGLGKAHGDVIHEVGNGADAHARVGLDLKAGDGGTAGARDLSYANAEALQHLSQGAGVLGDLGLVCLILARAEGKHIRGGE